MDNHNFEINRLHGRNKTWFNNTFITDGWEGYNWIRQYRYNHKIHFHGRHDFGRGNQSTSYIESIWGIFKGMIIKYYNALFLV